ncbi:MAG: hypothetical protein IJO56_06415 [Oscillospiraceae bacterium]|nr:hypothetical protein [Oscillospiraceae bacterium]
MGKKDFVDPSKYSVLIPYADFEKIVSMAKKVDDMQKKYDHMEQMYVAMQEMWREALEKIAEIDRYI